MNIAGAYLGWGLCVSEAGLALWRRSSKSSGGQRRDANSLWALWIVNLLSIAAGIALASLRIGPRLPAGFPWAWIGVAVFAGGTVLRWWSIFYLGRFFTVDVAVATDHRVVDGGPYRLIRHPSYSGLLLQFLGLGLTFGTVPSVAAVFIPPLLALSYRIRVEEAALRQGLGEVYVRYTQGTKRLVPWVF